MREKIVGKRVLFFPNKNDVLPNNMTHAPGIVVQDFNGEYYNLVVFVADPKGMPVMNIWSVKSFKDFTTGPPEGTSYFIVTE
jgi:hypothetical protein